ncbi:MAG TPA: esterase [Cytophagales bacterium]|nr:esterase [Cytophagales bacterium]HAA19250.1 esterase [Cytophagales bacterium]HAP62521.1 esterase [Cytophagales bacterium]
MKHIFSLTIFCCFFSTGSIAQENGSPIQIGIHHTFTSAVLNEDQTLQIYTPEGYESSEEQYPVLYILDGQWHFLSGVSIQKALRTPGAIPEMIIVGINTGHPSREDWFYDKPDEFTSFLVDEVLHYIDSNYRTSKERIIFGWEAAAYCLSELMFKKSEIFDGIIISDGGYASEELVKEFNSKKDIYLFMANSRKDIYYIGSTDAFQEVLTNINPKNLIWEYQLFNDEVHETLAHLALYKGLKFYYHNYDSPVFESVQQFEDLGGMEYLNTYFKERAKRFGGDGRIDNGTKDALIWLAWNRDNFEYFHLFMTEFEDVLATTRYASAYWQNRFGQFYLKHEDFPNAIKYFEAGLTQYPGSNLEQDMQQGLAVAKRNSN